MGSWLALIGSTMLGTVLLLSLLRFNNDLTQELFMDGMDNANYYHLTNVTEVLQADLESIGLGVNDSGAPIFMAADSENVSFFLDIGTDGILDSMRYFVGDVNTAPLTPNPRDRLLYRVVNGGTPQPISVGLTDFHIDYFDMYGNETADVTQIRTLEIGLACESTIVYDDKYTRMTWRGKVTPPSLVIR